MSQTLTTADAALKDFYLPAAREQLNNEVFLLSQLEQNTEDVEGRNAVLSIHTGRNHGVGARAENGTLPTAGRQKYAEQRVGLAYNYGRIQVSGPTIRAMGSDRGSFVRAVESETSGVVRDLKKDVNRQCYGDGSGHIAQCGTTTSDTEIVLASTTTSVQMRHFAVDMVVDIGTDADPDSIAAGRTITAVDKTNKTITISGAAVTTSSSHYVTRAGSGDNELTGLDAIVSDTGTLYGVDPTTYDVWKSYVDGNSGTNRAVSEDMFIEADQEVNIASGENINLWITSAGVHRNVSALLTSLKRFPGTNNLKGGYTGLDMSSVSEGNQGANEVTMKWDSDCKLNTAFGLCTRKLQDYRMSDWEFMDDDGAVLNRVPNTDAYEATLFLYSQPATDQRNAHARIDDLTA